ncbi:hypothetical protein DFP72DRAFT_1081043 [Ephemerocybe angulata]|uniref:Uncharacterized protein n=1 Tax=Ephemerocybe angulata TaxID=980116 RepID=A0A8H6H9J1_9AGAR|nr:hypothetical protein DFP72DRAFT_1081043 [Tulosesus angulatus]
MFSSRCIATSLSALPLPSPSALAELAGPTVYTIHVNVRRLTRLRSRLRDIVFSPGFNFDRYLNRPVSMSNTPLYETLHGPGAVRRRRRSQG